MTQNTPSVSVLGLGAMGRALAAAALSAGHPTTVWNRTAARGDELVARGARRAASAADAVAAADVCVICLLDDAAVGDTLASADLAGRTLINLTSSTPEQARATAARFTERGARYVDGGIMAVPSMIGGPRAFVLYSGDSDAFAAAEPVLAAFGAPRFLGGDPGAAALQDLALLSAMYGLFAGARHATELVRGGGVDLAGFRSELLVPWLEAMLASVSTDEDSGESPADMQITGIETMLRASRDQAIPEELTGHLHAALYALRAA